ncbi:MAG: pentapeptide repeat-containing protein, partial [Hydrococcus sp. RM1_1_31]|nr:pentapeptide repeat-containing protein [Hydrococcus sp. RM1_1_31]
STFDEASLVNADLSFAALYHCHFGEANLTGANLSNANLLYTTFGKANLTSANLRGAIEVQGYGEAILQNTIMPDGSVK